MYRPAHFTEDRVDVMAAFMRDHPFATLITAGTSGLIVTHLPMLWGPEPAPFGTLTGHFARPNPHARELPAAADSLAIFVGAQAYVSPSWYPAKREHGKVVPTWNYVTVHAHGPLALIDDVDWLRAFVTRLTSIQESALPRPWRIEDAPEEFVAHMLRGIIGVELPIRRLEGKSKLGQNRSTADYDGTIAGLVARGDAASCGLAEAMTAWRRDRTR